jgi:hypothetical protein
MNTEKTKVFDPHEGHDTDMLTLAQLAEWLGVSRTWASTSAIPRTRVGRRVFFPRGAVRQWLVAQAKSPKKTTSGNEVNP